MEFVNVIIQVINCCKVFPVFTHDHCFGNGLLHFAGIIHFDVQQVNVKISCGLHMSTLLRISAVLIPHEVTFGS